MRIEASTFNFYKEAALYQVANPILNDFSKPLNEAMVSDVPIGQVRAVYPLVHAAHSDRLTKNFTWYPLETLRGKDSANPDEATGLYSFVKPHGKPFLKEHRSQDFLLSEADVPMGRVVFAGYKKYKPNEVTQTPLSKKGYPGTAEGTGVLMLVPAITDESAINRVLGGQYHTVSIGSYVGSVIESISGKDIAALARAGNYDDMPDYRKGQVYKVDGVDQLSYWIMKDMHGLECSFVNVPADSIAKVEDKDIGERGIRLLLGEKKPGTKEFALFDALTGEKLDWLPDEGAIDESFSLEDSVECGKDTWLLSVKKQFAELAGAATTESAEDEADEMNITEKIQEGLKDLSKLIELKSEDGFAETLVEVVNANAEAYKAGNDAKLIAAGNPAKGKIEDAEAFQAILDKAIEAVGELNETAAKLAFCSYIEGGGAYDDPEIAEANAELLAGKATYGELYALEENHPLYGIESGLTRQEIADLPEESFAGENRTFPIVNLTSAALAARLCETLAEDKQGKVQIKVQDFGVFMTPEGNQIWPATIGYTEMEGDKPVRGSTAALYTVGSESDLTPAEGALDAYGEDVAKGVTEFLQAAEAAAKILFTEKLEEAPLCDYKESSPKLVQLGAKFLFEAFVTAETASPREYLLPLVAIARSKNISKQEMAEATKAYNIFGMKALESLLKALPEKAAPTPDTDAAGADAPEQEEGDEEEGGQLETANNPAAAPADAAPENAKSKTNESWQRSASRPLRPSGKKNASSKEKR